MTSTATEALAFAKGFSSRTESCARCTMPNKVPNGLIAARLRACDLELPLDRESFGEAEDFYGLSCRVYQTPHGLARFTHGRADSFGASLCRGGVSRSCWIREPRYLNRESTRLAMDESVAPITQQLDRVVLLDACG